MNPALRDSEELAKAKKRPEFYRLQFSGEFVEARSALLPPDIVDAAILTGKQELLPAEVKDARAALGCDFATSGDDCSASICATFRDYLPARRELNFAPVANASASVNTSFSGGRVRPPENLFSRRKRCSSRE